MFPLWVSQVVLVVKNPPASAGGTRDTHSIPGSGRSPGGDHGNPLQYSCLENPTDKGAWWATVSWRVGHNGSDLICRHALWSLYTAIYTYIWLFSVADLLSQMHFNNFFYTQSAPPHIYCFNIIFYIMLFCISLNYLLWIQKILLCLSFNILASKVAGLLLFIVCLILPMRFSFS